MMIIYKAPGLFALDHPRFGWSISYNHKNYQPLSKDWFTCVELEHFKSSFGKGVYPQGLRDAIAHQLRLNYDIPESFAWGDTVQPAEPTAAQLQVDLQEALHRLAMVYLFTVADMAHPSIHTVVRMLADRTHTLSLRNFPQGQRQFMKEECQITIERPQDPAIAALFEGIIPFTPEA